MSLLLVTSAYPYKDGQALRRRESSYFRCHPWVISLKTKRWISSQYHIPHVIHVYGNNTHFLNLNTERVCFSPFLTLIVRKERGLTFSHGNLLEILDIASIYQYLYMSRHTDADCQIFYFFMLILLI